MTSTGCWWTSYLLPEPRRQQARPPEPHRTEDQRGELFWELMDQLVRHEVAEAVVYPALRQDPGRVARS